MSASMDDMRWRRNPSDAMVEQTFLSEVFRRLSRRKLLIFSLTILLFGVIFLGIAMLPRSYDGVASVAIEAQTPSAVQATTDVLRDMPFDDQTIGTEVAILGSRQLLTDTISATGLLTKPEFNPTLRRPGIVGQVITNLRATLETYWPDTSDVEIAPSEIAMADTISSLRAHIKLVPVTRSRIIEIKVSANNNKLAAQIANKIADLYILNHREYRQSAIREAHGFLDAKIGELRQDAADKTALVENYRISHGLTVAMTATLIQEQLSKISEQLQLARGRLADLEGRATSAKGSDPAAQSQLLISQTMSNLRTQEATLATEQARLLSTYGSLTHPMLGRINAQLGGVRGQIAAEAARFRQSVPNDVAAAKVNVATLTKQMETIRAEAAQSEEARVHLATLQDDADTARKIYNGYLTRLRETDATMAYLATNVRVISYSAVPIRPSFPNYLIMVPSGFVLSVLLAGFTAYYTTASRGMVGRTDIENLFNGVRALGLIPLRTASTASRFDTAIEQLLNRLIMMDDHPRSIMITSAFPQEGKTTTARALAEAAKRRGIRVFLVDADMRSALALKPKTTARVMGLGDVLRGEVTVKDVVRNSGGDVPMLPAGTPRGNPTSLMALPSLKQTLDRLTIDNDLVIVDAPPVLVGGDCEMLSMAVDTTVLLAKWPAQPENVALALRELDPQKLAGMVLTMVDLGKMGRYGSSDAVLYSKNLHRYYPR